MNIIDKIANDFYAISNPLMSAPNDEVLTKLRQSIETDVDSIAGLLSYEEEGRMSPYINDMLELTDILRKKLTRVISCDPAQHEDREYQKILEKFIEEEIIISSRLSGYLKDKYGL